MRWFTDRFLAGSPSLADVSVCAVWLHQTRIGLSLYDVAGHGYLKESVSGLTPELRPDAQDDAPSSPQDLENYILELIPTLPQLDGLEKSFYSFYVCTAVRKFFFFLDPLRTGEAAPQQRTGRSSAGAHTRNVHLLCVLQGR